jgi:hypothetical protein
VTCLFGSARSPSWLRKKSTKTESVPIRKTLPKHLPKVTRSFGSAHSPYSLRKSQRKWSRCRLEIVTEKPSKRDTWIRKRSPPLLSHKRQRNNFQRWLMNSWAPATLVDSKIVHENYVAIDSEIITETPYKGDAWIRNSSQPLLTQKKSTKKSQCRLGNHHRKTFQRWRVDYEVLAAFVDSEKVNETFSKCDAKIRQCP